MNCLHDHLQANVKIEKVSAESNQELLEQEYHPIRIHFDMSGFLEREDSKMCKRVGQTVSWEFGTLKCTKNDLMDDDKMKVLSETLDNLGKYISKLVSVKRSVNPINVKPFRDFNVSEKKYFTDLVVCVTLRPFEPEKKTLGAAFCTKTGVEGRPILSGMYINPSYIPNETQNELSLKKTFFHTLFHELIHSMGFSSSMFPLWINKETGKKYNPFPLQKYTNPKYPSKVFSILQTPAARKFIYDRFGITEFAPGVKSGIELEDGGGSGVVLSHPESRVYLSEVMCGIFVGYCYVSKLTLAVLDDMGWYQVNYSMADLYPWGDGRSLGKQHLSNFINSPPQIAYPKHYLCWDDTPASICNYDHLSKGYCSPNETFDCDKNNEDYRCKIKMFANPKNQKLWGSRSEFDYLFFKVPNVSLRCDDESNNNIKTDDEYYGKESMCAMSTITSNNPVPKCYKMICTNQNQLNIYVGNVSKQCFNENQEITFDNYQGKIICPNPNIICNMKSFFKLPKTDLSELPKINQTETQSKINIINLCKLMFVFIEISICCFCCIINISENRDNDDYLLESTEQNELVEMETNDNL